MQAQKAIPSFTRTRLIDVLVLLWFYYSIFHMTRRIVGITRTHVEESLGLSTSAVSWIDTAFITYSISQMSYGTYRRFTSTRVLLYGGIVFTAISCTLYALSSHLWQLLLWWAINGVAQGTGWPTCVSVIGNWIFPEERGVIMGVWGTNNAAGGVMGTIVPTFLMSCGLSWRAAILVEVAMVLAVGALIGWRLKQNPNQVGMPSAPQALKGLTWDQLQRQLPLELDAEGMFVFPLGEGPPTTPTSLRTPTAGGAAAAAAVPVPTVVELIQLRGVAVYAMSYWIQQLVRYAFMAWLPTYLPKAQGFTLAETGVIASSFDVAGVAGILLTGYLADRLFEGRRRVKLMLLLTVAQAASITLLGLLSPHLKQRTFACMFFVILAGFFSFAVESLASGACILGFCENIHTPVGPVVGLVGGFGAIGSVLQGPLSGVFGDRDAWRSLFVLFGVLSALSGLLMMPVFILERDAAAAAAAAAHGSARVLGEQGGGSRGGAEEEEEEKEDATQLKMRVESVRWHADEGTVEEDVPPPPSATCLCLDDKKSAGVEIASALDADPRKS